MKNIDTLSLCRMAALLLVGMLFFVQSISANAQVPFNVYQGTEGVVGIYPQWTNVNDITLDLYFEDGEAGCSGEIRALLQIEIIPSHAPYE